jgi:RNA polymerase sigma factor (sigma-70 family)
MTSEIDVAVQRAHKEGDSSDPMGPGSAFYRSELHRYLMKRLRNSQDAHDLAQEAFLRYLQLPNVSLLRNPKGYLFRIAVNLISEWQLRRDRSTVTFNSDLADKRSSVLQDATTDVSEQLSSREHLLKILEQIPPTYRRVLLMNKAQGLSYWEIAEKLNVAPETVLKYLARATAAARKAQFD